MYELMWVQKALYGGAPVQTMDESACRLVCALDTQCYGYTWVQPSNPTWAGNCYRKGTTACNPNVPTAVYCSTRMTLTPLP